MSLSECLTFSVHQMGRSGISYDNITSTNNITRNLIIRNGNESSIITRRDGNLVLDDVMILRHTSDVLISPVSVPDLPEKVRPSNGDGLIMYTDTGDLYPISYADVAAIIGSPVIDVCDALINTPGCIQRVCTAITSDPECVSLISSALINDIEFRDEICTSIADTVGCRDQIVINALGDIPVQEVLIETLLGSDIFRESICVLATSNDCIEELLSKPLFTDGIYDIVVSDPRFTSDVCNAILTSPDCIADISDAITSQPEFESFICTIVTSTQCITQISTALTSLDAFQEEVAEFIADTQAFRDAIVINALGDATVVNELCVAITTNAPCMEAIQDIILSDDPTISGCLRYNSTGSTIIDNEADALTCSIVSINVSNNGIIGTFQTLNDSSYTVTITGVSRSTIGNTFSITVTYLLQNIGGLLSILEYNRQSNRIGGNNAELSATGSGTTFVILSSGTGGPYDWSLLVTVVRA